MVVKPIAKLSELLHLMLQHSRTYRRTPDGLCWIHGRHTPVRLGIVPASSVPSTMSRCPMVDTRGHLATNADGPHPEKARYGRHVWLCARDDAWRMDGIYGQFSVMMPHQQRLHHRHRSLRRAGRRHPRRDLVRDRARHPMNLSRVLSPRRSADWILSCRQ